MAFLTPHGCPSFIKTGACHISRFEVVIQTAVGEFEAKTANTEIGEDFYGDSEYDPDELDRDGFEGLSESPFDNPYDDDRY